MLYVCASVYCIAIHNHNNNLCIKSSRAISLLPVFRRKVQLHIERAFLLPTASAPRNKFKCIQNVLFVLAAAACLFVKYLLMETNLINANKLFFTKANKASEVEGFICVYAFCGGGRRRYEQIFAATQWLFLTISPKSSLDVETHIKCTNFHLGFPCSLSTSHIYHCGSERRSAKATTPGNGPIWSSPLMSAGRKCLVVREVFVGVFAMVHLTSMKCCVLIFRLLLRSALARAF